MHTENMCALLDSQRNRACCSPGAILNRLLDKLTDEAFSRGTNQQGESQPCECPQLRKEVQVVDQSLPKPDSRIQHDLVFCDPSLQGKSDSLNQKILDFLDDVVVLRRLLHRLGSPLHMHEHHPNPGHDNRIDHGGITP